MIQQIRKRSRLTVNIFSLLCACLLSGVMLLFSENLAEKEALTVCYNDLSMPEDADSILNDVILYTVNSRLEGQSVYAEADDAELFFAFRGEGRSVHGVGFLLKESFLHDVECTLFYPDSDGEYAEEGKDVFTLPKGERLAFFRIPAEIDYKMRELRIDIDEDYIIEDILVSQQPLDVVYELRQPKWPAVIYLAAWFAFFELFFYYLPAIRRLLVHVLAKRRKIGRIFLLLAGSAFLGNGAAFLLFRLAGKAYTPFWMALLGFCSMMIAYQLYLLLRTDSPYSLKKTRKTARITQWTFWCCILIFGLMIGFEWIDGSGRVPELSGIIRFQFPFVFAGVEVLLLSFLFRKYILNVDEGNVSFFNAYLFVFFLLGLGYMLVFLPYVSPDEPSHYVSAYRVSNLMLGNFSQWGEERLLMRMEDYQLFDQRQIVLSSGYYEQVTENFSLFAGNSGYVAVDAPMVTNAVFAYLTSGLGIAVARVLHLGAELTFYAGRLANLIFFLLILRYLMKKIPFGRTALFAIAMMPMTIHTAASYSYDVSTFCFAALFVTQVMCMMCTQEKITRRDYLLCLIFAVLIGPSKFVYLPLLFLILLVPGDKLGKSKKDAWKKKGLIIGTGFAAALVITLVVALSSAHSTVRQMMEGDTAAGMLTWIDEPGYTLSWILGHVGEYVLMNVRTVLTMADNYFFTLVGSMLGWLDVSIPYVYAIFSFGLFFLAINIRDDASARIHISIGKKIWILILNGGTVLATILVMAVSWTPVSYDYIVGVQGRYFLPLLLPMIWLFRNDMIRVDSVIRKHIVLLEAALNVWILVYVFARNIMRL